MRRTGNMKKAAAPQVRRWFPAFAGMTFGRMLSLVAHSIAAFARVTLLRWCGCIAGMTMGRLRAFVHRGKAAFGRGETGRTRVSGLPISTSKALVASVVVIVWGVFSAQVVMAVEPFPRDRMVFPFVPAAAVQGPASLRFNPAGLSLDQSLGANYYHTFSDSSLNGNDGLYISVRGAGFGVEWLGADSMAKGRSYTLGFSTSQNQMFGIGLSYQWRSSDDPVQNKSHFWTYGFTWRPSATTSLAAVFDNFNRMKVQGERSPKEITYSGAFHFLDNRLMAGGDWYQLTTQSVWDGTWRLGVSYAVRPGLTLFADLDKQKNYFLGARMDLTNFSIGTHSRFENKGGYRGGVAYVAIGEARRKPLVRVPREVVHLRLSGPIPDRQPARRLFGSSPRTLYEWISLLDKSATDPTVKAVVLTIDSPGLGWARIAEMRRALARVRACGKTTVAFLPGVASNGEYYLATAADRIVVPPVSTTNVLGLRAEVTFVKRLLDKVGIKADMEHSGEYKNASDLVTRTSMSEAHRRALNSLLDDMDSCWIADMAESRRVTPAQVRQWIEHGPFVSEDARSAGLVDAVAYPDQLDSLVRSQVGGYDMTIGANALEGRRYHSERWGPAPTVAVVCAEGVMAEGEDQENLFAGPVMGSRTISRAIASARRDHHVRAVVLRVNSGGGSMFASDEIWREVSLTVGRKPIVVSFGDEAASGGYYMACAADSIFAMPNTVTGSIGVIVGKLDLSGLYDKIGFDKEVVTRGRFADINGSTRSYDDEERTVMRDEMNRAYQHFVDVVAAGRHIPADSVNAIGQGRVWSGSAAKRLGLVDRYTDLEGAIMSAARMAGVKAGQEVQVKMLPKRQWKLFELSLGTLGGIQALGASLIPGLGLAGQGSDDSPSYSLPFAITVK
ncbi:MAG: signal peptide peptidase SppA [candidate division Zixibacteria bacterium]|nr:signal peptide peptidase SppA [candidate division Zixibacteria bacterium]